jgi:chromosome segregation ATPase
MNNFGIAQEATATAINSSGSAMKEQQKYANSLEARINRLDTAWNKFTLAMGKAVLTDGLISGIETLNTMATGVAGLVDKFGILSATFGIIGVAVTGLNTKFRGFTTALMFGTEGMTRAQLASSGLAAGMTRLGIATTGVKFAMRGLLASTVVGLIFVGIGYAIEKLIDKYGEAKKAQEAYEQSVQKDIEAMGKNKQETESLIKQYNDLTDAKKEAGKNWTSEQEQTYLQVTQKLADIYPSLVSSIDGAGRSHLKSKEQIEKEIEATNRLIEAKKLETQADANKNINKAINKRDDIKDKIKETQKQLDNPFDVQAKGKVSIVTPKSDSEIKRLKGQLILYKQEWSDLSQSVNSEVLKIAEAYNKLKIDPSISQSVDEFFSGIDTSKLKPEELEKFAQKIGKAEDMLQKAYANGDTVAFDKAKKSIKEIAEQMGGSKQIVNSFALSYDGLKKSAELSNNAVYAGKDGMDGIDESATEATKSLTELVQAEMEKASVEEQMVGTTQSLIDKTKDQITAYQMLSNAENLSADQKDALAEATKYLNTLYPQFVENGKLNVEQMRKEVEAQDILLKSVKDVADGHASAEQMMTTNQALQARNRLQIMSAELSAMQKLMETYESAAKHQEDMAKVTGDDRAYIQAQKFHNAQQKVSNDYANTKKQIDALIPSYNSNIQKLAEATDYQGEYYKATDKSNDKTKDSIYVSDKFKQKLEEINAQLAKYEDIQKRYPNYSKEYQDALKSEISLLGDKKKLIEDQAKSLQSQIKSGNVKQYGMVSSSTSVSSYSYGNSNEDIIWNFLKSKGLSDSAVAGVMGNLQMESSLNPNALGRPTKQGRAFGIAQWLGGRRTGLENFAKQRGTSSSDINTQLEWLWHELTGSEKSSLDYLMSNSNASASTIAAGFDRKFERSEGTSVASRQKYANNFYNQFSGKGGTSVSSSGAETAQSIDQAKSDLLQLQQDAMDVANQIKELQFSLIEAKLAKNDKLIADSENKVKSMDRTSLEYRKEIDYQWKLSTEKAKMYRQAIADLTKTYGENSIYVQRLKDEYADLQSHIADLNWEYYTSEIDQYANKIESLNQQIEVSSKRMELYSDSFSVHQQETKKQIELYKELIKSIDGEREVMERSIRNNFLNAQQKEEMKKKLQDLNKEYLEYQLNLKNIITTEKEMINQKVDDLIDAYKDFYNKKRDLEQKSLDDELSAYEKVTQAKLDLIDKEEKARDNSRELSDKQKEIADLQAQIVSLSMDSSQTGKVADLRKQLTEKQNDLGEFVHNNEVEARKDALNQELDAKKEQIDKEKVAVDKYYDDIVNDERKFAKIREDILNGHTDAVLKQLGEFKDYFTKHAEDIGLVITNNILDKINKVTESIKEAGKAAKDISLDYQMSTVQQTKTATDQLLHNTDKPDEVTILEDTPFLQKGKDGTYEFTDRVLKKGEKYKAYGVDYQHGIYTLGGGYVTADPKKTKYQFFQSGGYTGNDEGLAYLHEKELILNKMDTSNILKAVDLVRQMTANLPKFTIPKFMQNPVQPQPNIYMNVTLNEVQNGKQVMDEVYKEFNKRLRGKGGLSFG